MPAPPFSPRSCPLLTLTGRFSPVRATIKTVRRRWEQFRSSLARRVRYKVTRGGLLFSFGILLVGLAAILSANNLLFLIAAAMLATLLVSGFVSRLSLAGLELDFLAPEHVSPAAASPASCSCAIRSG